MNKDQLSRMRTGQGFIAALDQSGGSTPKALAGYGIGKDAYSNDEEMFDLVHLMRTRVIKSPAFNSDRILGAILFEMTMDRKIDGKYTADYLYEGKGVVPFLKIDKGLAEVKNGCQLMKPMPDLDALLNRAVERHIFGTKERSVIGKADKEAIKEVVDQQFEVARKVIAKGLVPIIEPEITITIPDKEEAEQILHDLLKEGLSKLGEKDLVMLKLSIPTKANLYRDLMEDPHVVRVVALSGGYPNDEACRLLSLNNGMIASFSRALLENLRAQQSDAEFDAHLGEAIEEIYQASIK